MLELVPEGVNKWVGLQALLPDLALPAEAVMAIGDGSNDLQIVANVGLGVAMGNAVPEVSALHCPLQLRSVTREAQKPTTLVGGKW